MDSEDSCKDCAYTTCDRLHSYAAHECKLSGGKPCQECAQMVILDSQISQVHSQLVQLAHKRHALKTKINQRHEPFIHRLPWPVSSQIFEEYVHHSDFDPKVAIYSTYTRDWSPALFLSSICAQWRKIAFATSEIWRFINIPLLEDNPDVGLKIKLLKACVDRACQRTLFIGVFQFQLDEVPLFSRLEGKLDILEPLFEVIKEIACRSEEITLWGLPPLALQLIIPTNTPNLTVVRIGESNRYYPDEAGAVEWNFGDFSLAGPLLRNLDVGLGSGTLLHFCHIGWDTITTVAMSAINVKESIDILRQASCLTSFSFTLQDSYDTNPATPPIVNSTLEKLHIDSSKYGVDFVKFASSVTLPSLRELSLRTSTLSNMKPLFERSQCQVRTFSLSLWDIIPEDDVLELLKILPSVEHLALQTSVITSKFFEELGNFRDSHFKASGDSANLLLPNLTSLSYTGIMHFTWPAFLKMFSPPGDVVLAAQRPLSEVSLKLDLPKNTGIISNPDVIVKLHEIQQSKVKLVVTNFKGKDLI